MKGKTKNNKSIEILALDGPLAIDRMDIPEFYVFNQKYFEKRNGVYRPSALQSNVQGEWRTEKKYSSLDDEAQMVLTQNSIGMGSVEMEGYGLVSKQTPFGQNFNNRYTCFNGCDPKKEDLRSATLWEVLIAIDKDYSKVTGRDFDVTSSMLAKEHLPHFTDMKGREVSTYSPSQIEELVARAENVLNSWNQISEKQRNLMREKEKKLF